MRAPGPYPGVTIACVEAFYPGKSLVREKYGATSVLVVDVVG